MRKAVVGICGDAAYVGMAAALPLPFAVLLVAADCVDNLTALSCFDIALVLPPIDVRVGTGEARGLADGAAFICC